MTRSVFIQLILLALVVLCFAALPFMTEGFYLTLAVNIALYVALCTAWTLFSGPTHLVSLATAAFFGVGIYATAIGVEYLPFPVVILLGGLAGAVFAAGVGAMTLRLSGVYFVIFTLGLAELARQLVTYFQTKIFGSIGLFVLTDHSEGDLFHYLLALIVVIFVTGWLIGRSRLGFAMRVIGNDELVARHFGIEVARSKIILFVISGAFIAMAGAIMAPRYAYVEPASAFNSTMSFLVVIMALLGGTRRLWGPLVGVVPFTIIADLISAYFPEHINIIIGLGFLLIVYLLKDGVSGILLKALGSNRLTRAQGAKP
ncbi:branched-chain amino acid ABC transporter permease [Roseinatronobacter alkalisoli]|uniref:Branched-chain amino acid ABC transporter permease n=1 Tax=Roseinatronobacter alkalisoli TaxID=3028235 RepID=A0ABT5TCK2_9RHOB|nr:branched-chain amino acid ABC transporter permease [Roseinatronobacter sp. HJB301]MDD7972854.1 branched-chain amino acid ABC transporter permease [Roseinatronobacter sp. HJB301]